VVSIQKEREANSKKKRKETTILYSPKKKSRNNLYHSETHSVVMGHFLFPFQVGEKQEETK
jgi:hypothetical protein